jgi:hypothetical protein
MIGEWPLRRPLPLAFAAGVAFAAEELGLKEEGDPEAGYLLQDLAQLPAEPRRTRPLVSSGSRSGRRGHGLLFASALLIPGKQATRLTGT